METHCQHHIHTFEWRELILKSSKFDRMNNYKLLGRAGEGAHGFVFKGIDLRTDTMVAMKKIGFNPNQGVPINTIREICSLRVLKNKNIVKLLEVTAIGGSVVLVMEYLPWSLADLLKHPDIAIRLPQVKTYSRMILNGVSYMHQNHIMHRDLKPANLLIDENGLLKIADFGLARIYDRDKRRLYSHQVATRWYRAPELLYGARDYTPSIDMWSVGCIIAELLNGRPLFAGDSDIEQLAIVLNTLGTPTEENWPGLTHLPDYNKIAFSPNSPKDWHLTIPKADDVTIDLIGHILIYDDFKRMSAKQALRHKFFHTTPLPCKLSQMPNLEDLKRSEESLWNFIDFDECIKEINEGL